MMLEDNQTVVPETIRRIGSEALAIRWSDGRELDYTVAALRDGCPCATCKEKQRAKELEREKSVGKPRSLPILTSAELNPLTIVRMQPIGNYAYSIAFSDGHSSGIYSFSLLRQLGKQAGDDSPHSSTEDRTPGSNQATGPT